MSAAGALTEFNTDPVNPTPAIFKKFLLLFIMIEINKFKIMF
jgi:hypothetical protein